MHFNEVRSKLWKLINLGYMMQQLKIFLLSNHFSQQLEECLLRQNNRWDTFFNLGTFQDSFKNDLWLISQNCAWYTMHWKQCTFFLIYFSIVLSLLIGRYTILTISQTLCKDFCFGGIYEHRAFPTGMK